MDMTFWRPQAEAGASAGGGAVMEFAALLVRS